jgi:copper transport protein
LSLTFSEPVTATAQAVTLTGPTPALRPISHAVDGGRTLHVDTGPLRDGRYTVAWQVTADDGDVVNGSYQFAVGTATASPSAGPRLDAVTGSLVETAAGRWLLFTALAVALGGLAGSVLVRRLTRLTAEVSGAPLPPGRLLPMRAACALGVVAAVALAAHAVNGSSFLTGLMSLRPWDSRGAATVPLTEALLFAVAAAVLSVPRARLLAVLPLLGVAAAEGLRGHLHEQDGLAGAALVGVHIAAAAAWTGALAVIALTAARWRAAGRSNAAWQLVHAYSRSAVVAYLLTVTTGAVAAVLLLPSWTSLTSTRYGVALLVKLVVVVAVTGLALTGRARLRRSEPNPAALRLRWPEPAALTAVLLVAAVLVSLVPPKLLAAAAAPVPPPAPVGPTVQLGTLAGQLTVGVTVSSGQIRIQVSSPSSDDSHDTERFTVKARTIPAEPTPGRSAHTVRLTACGNGCFAGPATVTAPGLTLDLTVAAPGWHGGHPSLRVPWPPKPASALLRLTLAALARAPALTWQESVTSNTTQPTPPAITIHDSGRRLLDSEVYGDGRGLTPYELPAAGQLRRFGFAVGGTFFVEMTVDAAGKLVHEQVITPNHLITRDFS